MANQSEIAIGIWHAMGQGRLQQRPCSRESGKNAKLLVISDIQCPSLLATDGTDKCGIESSSLLGP